METAPARRRWKLAAAILVVIACYWPAMFVATHLPAKQIPGGIPPTFDKIEHLAGFAVLASLLCGLAFACGIRLSMASILVVAVIGLYGLLDELTQAFIPDRSPDWHDWLANMLGAAIGVGGYVVTQWLAAGARSARRVAQD